MNITYTTIVKKCVACCPLFVVGPNFILPFFFIATYHFFRWYFKDKYALYGPSGCSMKIVELLLGSA